MIEINLLPHREARKLADLRETIALLCLGLLLVCSGIFFVHSSLTSDLKKAHTSVRQLEAAIEQFKPQQDKVVEFKNKRSQLKDKLSVIESLELARTGPVRLFDELADLIPERLWLSSLKSSGKSIKLQGASIDTAVVADFLRSLNRSEYFSNVDLEKTQGGKKVDGVKLVDFKISVEFTNPEANKKSEG